MDVRLCSNKDPDPNIFSLDLNQTVFINSDLYIIIFFDSDLNHIAFVQSQCVYNTYWTNDKINYYLLGSDLNPDTFITPTKVNIKLIIIYKQFQTSYLDLDLL